MFVRPADRTKQNAMMPTLKYAPLHYPDCKTGFACAALIICRGILAYPLLRVRFFALVNSFHLRARYKVLLFHVSFLPSLSLSVCACTAGPAQFRRALGARFPDFKPSIAGGDLIN